MWKRLVWVGGLLGTAFTAIRTLIWWIGDIQTVQSVANDRAAIMTDAVTIALHPLFGPSVVVVCLLAYWWLEHRPHRTPDGPKAPPIEPSGQVTRAKNTLSVKCDRFQMSRLAPTPDGEFSDQRDRDLLYVTGQIYLTNHTDQPMNLIPKLVVTVAPEITPADTIVRDALPLPIDHLRSRLRMDTTASETVPYLGRVIHVPPQSTAPTGYLAFVVEGALFTLTKMESGKDLWLGIREAHDARIEFEDRQTGIKRTVNIPGDSLIASLGT